MDFETTGTVNGYPNMPWQLGMVSLHNGVVQRDSLFSTFLRVPLDQPFNPYAPGRWATLRQEISQAPSLTELWLEVSKRLSGRVPCAHNIGTERTILTKAFPFSSFGKWLDTLALARLSLPSLKDYKLTTIIECLGLAERVSAACPGLEAHDALYDSFAAAFFLEFLFSQPGWHELPIEKMFLSESAK